MPGAHIDLVSLLFLLGGSLVMPMLSGRLRVPSAVLLIGYGVVVGPQMLHVVRAGPVLTFLYEVGFILLPVFGDRSDQGGLALHLRTSRSTVRGGNANRWWSGGGGRVSELSRMAGSQER